MGSRLKLLAAVLFVSSTAGCTTRADLPANAEAYDLIPAAAPEIVLRNYYLQPGDRISVDVYRETDLSISQVEVGSDGNFSMPLLGAVKASGKTTEQLAEAVRLRLSTRFLRDPRVAVNVVSAAQQRVIVDGSVNQPGIYELRGQTTLIGALALARGTSRTAELSEVAIFRRNGGKLVAAKFDVAAIRRGESPDVEIRPDDRVVVGFSGIKGAWRDFLQALPVFSTFRPLYN